VLGFDTALLAATTLTEQKINKTGTQPIINILTELSRRDGSIRRRLANIKNVYPRHEEFAQKISQYNPAELAQALKKLSFCAQTKVYLFWNGNK
jgi:hypothetical protein